MTSQVTSYPKEVHPDRWGPALLNGAKFYVFQGQKKLVPLEWQDNPQRFLKELNVLEKMNWAYALPHEREELFHKKLAVLTKDLPPDWIMIIGTTICGIIIIIQAASLVSSFVKSKL